MNQVWLQVLAIMICSSILKYVFVNPVIWVVIDLGVLGVAYILLKRYPYIDLKKSMMFLGGLTTVSVLVDIGVLSGMWGNVLVLALLAWMMFGGNNKRRR